MSRITVLIPIALATIGLTGCGAPKAINYYAIQIPAAPTPGAASYPIDVVVGRITASSLLEASPIIYRIGTSRIGTYKYHRWQDPPVELVQTKLLSMLRSSGGYRSVSSSTTPESEFLIRGRLHDFAEVDGESISGLVSMEFELYDRKTARVLWSH